MSTKKEWILTAGYGSDYIKALRNGYPERTKSLKQALKFATKMEAIFMIEDLEEWARSGVKPIKAETFRVIMKFRDQYNNPEVYGIDMWCRARWLPNGAVGKSVSFKDLDDAEEAYKEFCERGVKRFIRNYDRVETLIYCIRPYSKEIVKRDIHEKQPEEQKDEQQETV